jgi:hypothetical protein
VNKPFMLPPPNMQNEIKFNVFSICLRIRSSDVTQMPIAFHRNGLVQINFYVSCS